MHLNLGHEVALQANCWERLQSRLPFWGPGASLLPSEGSLPSPASSGVLSSSTLPFSGRASNMWETSRLPVYS